MKEKKAVYKTFEIDGKKVSKWLRECSSYEYDENGNEIFVCEYGNIEKKKKYDSNGRLVFEMDAYGNETEYDKNGNVVHFKNNSNEFWREYDSQGNVIYWKNDKGDEKKYERNNVIYKKTKDGYEIWYDMNRKIIHTKGECEETWYEYDNYGNKVYEKSVDGELETTKNITYVYSKNGIVIDSKCVRYSNNNDKRKDTYKWFKYDFNGDRIYYLNEDDTYKYTNDGLLIYTKDSYDDENWYEYEFFENGNVKKVVVFEPK